MIKLSIIIPVYNVEQYLAKCLDSVLNQDISLSEYEVIVVNDGSPDGSLSIAEDYASRFDNVKVVSRPNGGLSAARNTGLEHAQGEYVWFVDSDDWIEPNSLKKITSITATNNLDVLCINLQLIYDDGRVEKYIRANLSPTEIYDGGTILNKINMPPAAVCGIYRLTYLKAHNFKFIEGIYHEDQEFTSRVYCRAKRMSFLNDSIYDYYQREGSIMKSSGREISVKRSRDYLTIADSLYCFLRNSISTDSYSYTWLCTKIRFCVFQSLSYYDKSAYDLDELKHKPFYPLMIISGDSIKERVKVILANTSLSLYTYIVKKTKLR